MLHITYRLSNHISNIVKWSTIRSFIYPVIFYLMMSANQMLFKLTLLIPTHMNLPQELFA